MYLKQTSNNIWLFRMLHLFFFGLRVVLGDGSSFDAGVESKRGFAKRVVFLTLSSSGFMIRTLTGRTPNL